MNFYFLAQSVGIVLKSTYCKFEVDVEPKVEKIAFLEEHVKKRLNIIHKFKRFVPSASTQPSMGVGYHLKGTRQSPFPGTEALLLIILQEEAWRARIQWQVS